MGQVSHRKIRTIKAGTLRKYSRKSSEKRTIFIIGPDEYKEMKVISRTPFRYEGKMIERYDTDVRKIGWGSLVSKVAEENHIPFENVRYNDICIE